MIHQDCGNVDLDVDSNAEAAVVDGLMAAQRYENSRPRLSPTAQQEMLDESFPRLPDGVDGREEVTKDECEQIRAFMRDAADEKKARSIANLREQLTEYHSLLDKLSSVTEKCNALEKTCQEQGCHIQELEREVEALKRGHQSASCVVETTSCSDQEQLPLQAPFLPIVQEISKSPYPVHPSSPLVHHKCQAPSRFDGQFHDICQSSIEPYIRAPSPLLHISPGPSPPMSPVPSDWSIDPTANSTGYYSSQGIDCNTEYEQDDCNTEYEQDDYSLDLCLKRKSSYEYGTSSSSSLSGTTSFSQQHNKRFKSEAFSIPRFVEAFQWSSESHQCVPDTNEELMLMS